MIRRALHFQERLTGEPLLATIKRYLVFVFGGGIGWLIIIGMQAMFLVRLGEVPSYWIGLLFADIFTFVYHQFITFKIKSDWKRRFVKFSVIVVLISIANGTLFSLAANAFDLTYFDIAFPSWLSLGFFGGGLVIPGRILVSFVITVILSIINFAINRIFIFRHH